MSSARYSPILHRINAQPIINGVGPATRLGGLPLSEFVQKSMIESTKNNFRMEELHIAASELLSDLLKVEAALVTNSASASLTLAIASCLTGKDSKNISTIPNLVTFEKNVVIQKTHRDPYDHAVTMLGLQLNEAGYPTNCHKNEVKNAIDENTVAGLWRAGVGSDFVDLKDFIAICHAKNIPVVVDAALVVPPLARLQEMVSLDVDFVAISGGKGFRGPQASGLLVTKKHRFYEALLNHLDHDEREATWPSKIFETDVDELPRNGIGRGMKVGREQIFGLLAAVIEIVEHERVANEVDELEKCFLSLQNNSEIEVVKSFEINLDTPTLHIHPPKNLSVDDFFIKLSGGSPRIILGQEFTTAGYLTLNPMALQSGQGEVIAKRIIEIAEEDKLHDR